MTLFVHDFPADYCAAFCWIIDRCQGWHVSYSDGVVEDFDWFVNDQIPDRVGMRNKNALAVLAAKSDDVCPPIYGVPDGLFAWDNPGYLAIIERRRKHPISKKVIQRNLDRWR
jgi:hypothetical protein